jgi:hypothetical protein
MGGTTEVWRELLTQSEVESRIMDLIDQMTTQTEELAELHNEEARAEYEYKHTFALAFLDAEGGNQKTRESHALLAADKEFYVWRLSEARLKTAQQSLRTIATQLDSLRTISANLRAVT